VRLAPDKLSDPFITVLGAPAVPWHVDGGIPALALGLGSTVGPDGVSCPPLAFPMAFTLHRSTRASASPANAVQSLDDNDSDTLLALDGLQALLLMIIATDGTELEAWSHLKDHCWDWMDNPFFDAWFSAQARDPNSFVVDICSTKQIDTHWRQWVDDTTPQPDNHAVHFGTNNAMQHVKAALRHRVFRDNLLANATPSMAAKYRDFERRALQVFRGLDDPNPPLGTLPPTLQPYLYCLAHPSAKLWMAKFEVQHDLSLAPSYVKPFVPFDLPSATGSTPQSHHW